MKIRVLSTALLCLAAGIALAEPPSPPPGGPPGRDMERLTILLDLDAGQKVAVKKVLDEQHEQMKALRQQAKTSEDHPTHEQMRAHHEQMQTETVEKLRPILSDVQLKKFEALMEGGPMGGPGMRDGMRTQKAQ